MGYVRIRRNYQMSVLDRFKKKHPILFFRERLRLRIELLIGRVGNKIIRNKKRLSDLARKTKDS